jgi:hypothetical protein
MVRNESVIFGRHIDIEVSYKILQLEVPNWFQFCTIPLAFKRGCLEAVLSKNVLSPLGVKMGCFEAILSLKSSENFRGLTSHGNGDSHSNG